MTNKEWLISKTNRQLAILYCARVIPWFAFFSTEQQEDIIENFVEWIRMPIGDKTRRQILIESSNQACAEEYVKWAVPGFECFVKEQQNQIIYNIIYWLDKVHKEED